MEKFSQFLTMMAALSTASQTLTEHLIKKRFSTQLDTTKTGKAEDRRQSLIHLISGIIGAALAMLMGLHPLTELAQGQGEHWSSPLSNPTYGPILEYLLVGVLVSYGGSFFNELLGFLQQFKDAQAEVKKAIAAGGTVAVAPGAVVQQGGAGVHPAADH